MAKYLIKRILFSLFSLGVVLLLVMFMTYTLMDRTLVLKNDSVYTHLNVNEAELYKHDKFVKLGYEEYTNFTEYLNKTYEEKYGSDYQENPEAVTKMNEAKNALYDAETYLTNQDVSDFIAKYSGSGYTVSYLEKVVARGKIKSYPYLFAYHEFNVFERFFRYIGGMFQIETIYDVQDKNLTNRYIRWEWDQRSHMPALVGSGTTHKYLIYFDNQFPFIHQNLFHIRLGQSVVTYANTDVADVLVRKTGEITFSDQEFPVDLGTGVTHETSYDFHTVTYSTSPTEYDSTIYGPGEHYINAIQFTSGMSRIGNSFVIGILSVIICYIFGLPIGIWMAKSKDKLVDKLGNLYIIFIMAVPSLAYIFAFAAIGVSLGLPLKWASADPAWLAFVLPVLSLALPSIGGLMKWMRRFMIDQSNSDYVKFARSTGMTEDEIFRKHIAKNAFIFLVHNVPADILFALVGALITERVYAVPGIGGLLTNAIGAYDNGIIVAGTIFYSFLTILALILGDLLLAKYDPRVSFTDRN